MEFICKITPMHGMTLMDTPNPMSIHPVMAGTTVDIICLSNLVPMDTSHDQIFTIAILLAVTAYRRKYVGNSFSIKPN